MNDITIEYKFTFPDSTVHSYAVDIDESSLSLKTKEFLQAPEWTKLKNQQCVHCPLTDEQTAYCPIALNIASLAEFFKDKISFEKAAVTVTTIERTYSKNVTLQE